MFRQPTTQTKTTAARGRDTTADVSTPDSFPGQNLSQPGYTEMSGFMVGLMVVTLAVFVSVVVGAIIFSAVDWSRPLQGALQ